MERTKLKIARLTKLYKQIDVAKHIGVGQSYYSKIEKGTAKLSLDQAQALSKLLKINISNI